MDKLITFTVEVEGNKVSRTYMQSYTGQLEDGWNEKIESMLDTLENSKDVKEF